MNNGRKATVSKLAIIVSGALAVAGVALYVAEHAGVIAGNLSNNVPWGIYLAFFMLFAGIGAGCLMLAAIPRALGVKAIDVGLGRELAWTAFASLLLAGVFITIDLGNPLRMFELVIAPHPASPLFWDVLALPIAIVLALLYALGVLEGESASGKTFSLFVLAWGVFVLCVDAWILCSQPAHESWHSSILMPWFVVTGLLCGTALECLLAVWKGRDSTALAKLGAVLIICDAAFFALDLICANSAVRSMYLVGSLAPLFWTQMVLYACGTALFLAKPDSGKLTIVASIAVLVGVTLKRLALMTSGFQLLAFTLPDMVAQTGKLVYAPAVTEVACAIGMVGLGVLVALLGYQKIGSSID